MNYKFGVYSAHNLARNSLRMMREQPRYADFWRKEASRHFDRARWYIARLRMGLS